MTASRFKFRAWVPAEHWIAQTHNANEPKMIKNWQDCIYIEAVCFDALEEGIIVMQSTGLTDKNGKEIFEGDVVECSMSFEGGTLPHRGEVVYDNTFAGFATKNLGGVTLFHHHCLHTMQVIGNIYENPELLEANND